MPSESWVFFLLLCLIILVKSRLRTLTLQRYKARNQSECRVRIHGTQNRRGQGQWIKALATPYAAVLTLQLLESSAINDAEPLTVAHSDLIGGRAARISDALRFRSLRSGSWRIASYHSGAREIDVAAPSSYLGAVTGRGTGTGTGTGPGTK